MIKLALTDLDDTLIAAGTAPASAQAVAAMRSAMAGGVHCGPISGRPPSSLGWMFGPGNEDCWQTGAFSNGQMVYLDGRLARKVPLPQEALQDLVALMAREGQAYVTIFDVDGPGIHFVTDSPETFLSNPPRRYRDIGGDIVPALPAGPILKANVQCTCPPERMVALRDLANATIPDLELVFPGQGVPVIDILPRGWDKGRAVCFLAETLGLGLDEVAVFGDSENDLAMIRAVPNSVAVANAAPEVAAAARWHIGASADGAVAAALEDIALAAKAGTMPSFMQG